MPFEYTTIDSETCGLTGPIALFQYGDNDDGPVVLWSPWSERIKDTLDLYKRLTTRNILGFNLAFDWFKIQQQATTLMLLGHRVGDTELPINHIDEYALCEPAARDGPCFKPPSAMDLMLHARKGPWQNLMNRDPIIVRRIPIQIAPLVQRELEDRISIPDIFFAKRKRNPKDPQDAFRWKIKRIKTAEGVNPDFVNLQLDFHPSSALKALATHELKLDPKTTLVFKNVEVNKKLYPDENGFAPFALSTGRPGRWNWAWPDVIKFHHSHWKHNALAREYATKDIEYPRRLWDKWGRPEFGDVDSLLACMAGAMRWKGFATNGDGLTALLEKARERMKLAPRAPSAVVAWLKDGLAPEEEMALEANLKDQHSGNITTKKVVLEELRKLEECEICLRHEQHATCILVPHRNAIKAGLVLESRKGKKEVEIYEKLLAANRFHVSVNIIGARSSRQSGGQVTEGKGFRKSGSINPQGIQKKKVVREQFPLAFTKQYMDEACSSLKEMIERLQVDRSVIEKALINPKDEWASLGFPLLDEKLVGGDFDKFEVCIADAYYQDPQLHADLNGIEPPCEHGECKYSKFDKALGTFVAQCSRCTGIESKPGSVKIHAIVGTLAYKGRSYWDIRATDGKDRDVLQKLFPHWPQEHWADLYTRAKSAFFALIYFGDANTLVSRLAVSLEDAQATFRAIMARYPVMAQKRHEFYESFCPVRQPDGGQVFWNEPDDFVESMLGFQRFYTLENRILRALFDLAEDVPDSWRAIKVKVMRRDKEQTIAGAVRSALYGAAFGLQGSSMRSAGNHVIQSTGAGLTKMLQALIWQFQPVGIHQWLVRPMNVHDELPTACVETLEQSIAQVQKEFVKTWRRDLVPMLAMKWKEMDSWAGK